MRHSCDIPYPFNYCHQKEIPQDIGTGLNESAYLKVIIPIIVLGFLGLIIESYKNITEKCFLTLKSSNRLGLEKLGPEYVALIDDTSLKATAFHLRDALKDFEFEHAVTFRRVKREQFVMCGALSHAAISALFHSAMADPSICKTIFYFAGLSEKALQRKAFYDANLKFINKLNTVIPAAHAGRFFSPRNSIIAKKATLKTIYEMAKISTQQEELKSIGLSPIEMTEDSNEEGLKTVGLRHR